MSILFAKATRSKTARGKKKPKPGVNVIVDKEALSLAPMDLLDETIRNQLVERCVNAKSIPKITIDNLLAFPDDARWASFDLIKGIKRPIRLTTRNGKPLESLVDLVVHHARADLPTIKAVRLKRAVCEAVALEHPDALDAACQSICSRLRGIGVKLGAPQVLAKQARDLLGTEAKVSALDAARRTHEHVRHANELQGDLHAIRYFDDDFFVWSGSYWSRCHDKQFEAQVVAFLQKDPDYADHLTGRFVGDVVKNLKGQTLLNCWGQPMPLWIKAEEPLRTVRSPYISFSNGRINIRSTIEGEEPPRLLKHDPRHFSEIVLPYRYDPDATCPIWRKTLETSLANVSVDDHRIEVFQEMCGWALVQGDMRFEKFFVVFGRGANGKSTILKTFRALLGADNVSHVPLDQLCSEFRVVDMMGRLVNIAFDLNHVDSVAEGRLKELTSGDPIQVNRKHKSPITMVPTAKLIFACNRLPQFSDRSDGIWRRLIVIPFEKQFEGSDADKELIVKLRTELSGIFNWALAGARRLYLQGDFTICEVCQRATEKHRFDSDPFQQFCDECVVLTLAARVTRNALYSAYHEYCLENGRRPQSSTHFFEQVLQLDGVSECRPGSEGQRPRVFKGIKLVRPSPMGSSPSRPSKRA